MINPIDLKAQSQQKSKENLKYFKWLKVNSPKNLDQIIIDLNHEVFSHIDCLECAHCCKTLGPRLMVKDIDRIARYLKMKPDTFIDKFLKIDEDGDYVFQSMPCPFLGPDNYCSVYRERPKACADYPHTGKPGFQKRLMLTYQNTFTCPAAYEIVEKLKRIII